MSFHSFNYDYEWNYFRLDTGTLNPSGVYNTEPYLDFEEITEINPGMYLPRSVGEEGYYGYDDNGYEIELPKFARIVSRHLNGSFVIFCKTAAYNIFNFGTYDGRHNKYDSIEFEQYIRRNVERIRLKESNKDIEEH